MKTPRKWILSFFTIETTAILLLAAAAYFVDPFFSSG